MCGRLLHRVYAIGDAPVLDVHADCERMLDVLGLHASGTAGVAPDAMEIFLLGKEYSRAVRIVSPDDIAGGTPPLPERIRYIEWYGKGSALYDNVRNRAVLYVPGMRHYNPDFVSRGIVRPLLDRMLAVRGYIPLHAAAVAGRHAMMLSGKPGAGKTTLLMGLLGRGLSFLADDRAVLTHDAGKTIAHRFPEYIRSAESDGPKRSLLPDTTGVSSCELRLVVFIEPDRGPNRIERVSPAEGAARLLATIPPAVDIADWTAMSDMAVPIASAVPMWVLRGWDDVSERIGILERLMTERDAL